MWGKNPRVLGTIETEYSFLGYGKLQTYRSNVLGAPACECLCRCSQLEIQHAKSISLCPGKWGIPSLRNSLKKSFTLCPEIFKPEALEVWQGTVSSK